MGWFRVFSIDDESIQSIEGSFRFGDGDVIAIGRTSDNDVQVKNIKVSKHHAELVREDGQCFIKDMGSKNGTVVNGKKLEAAHYLKDKDSIGFFGKLKIVYYEEDPDVKLVLPIHNRGKVRKLTFNA